MYFNNKLCYEKVHLLVWKLEIRFTRELISLTENQTELEHRDK